MERLEREQAMQLADDTAVVAERLLAAALTATASLDTSRSPEEWKQGLIVLAFDLAERFLAECERRKAPYRW